MKTLKYTIAGIFAGLALLFLIATVISFRHEHAWEKTAAGDNENYAHKLKRYRRGAEAAIFPAITNVVVGLRTILSTHTSTVDNNFTKWTAEATVEFVNQTGGVERTNIQFKFGSLSGEPAWWPK